MTPTRVVLGLAAIVFALLPAFLGTYLTHVFIIIFYAAYLGSCWNLLGGFAGQLSLGHALFVGAGAYTSTLLFLRLGISPWVGMFAGGLVSAGIGLPISYLCFRYKVKGIFFMLVTLVFVEIARSLAVNIKAMGGARGLRILPSSEGDFWTMQFADKAGYYYVVLAMLVLILALTHLIKGSRWGYYFIALRENEAAAEALGVPLMSYRLRAVALSSFFTSWGGTFIAQYVTYIDPFTVLTFGLSIEILIYAIAGGLGTLFGAVAGAFVLVPAGELVRALLGKSYQGVHLMVYGAILMVVVVFAPEGIMGRLRSGRRGLA